MANKTVWKDIPNFPGYQISESGDILSTKQGFAKMMKSQIDCKTVCVQLSSDSGQKRHRIDELVATLFIPNPNNYKFIIYKDNNFMNTHMNNLEWTDNPYNSTELWEPLKNHPKYEISRSGVRNKETKYELLPSLTKDGYLTVTLKLITNHICMY